MVRGPVTGTPCRGCVDFRQDHGQVRLLFSTAAASSSTGFDGRSKRQPFGHRFQSKVSVPAKQAKHNVCYKVEQLNIYSIK
ncbi:hypothetical protein Pcinc_018767 [Petrolisthes cinctipes]|uniref:Uncharacterized protein n=1 Tax=Petrolisthes cinctipes TaxID=88211 RepID=A0AAE1FMV9_PETCI|nr:hypothetical protein Pcinc_018767 [Petrolisthes cinctipes]